MSDNQLLYKQLLDKCTEAIGARDFATALTAAEAAVEVAREEFGTDGVEFRQAVHLLAVAYVEGGNVVVGRALLEWLVRVLPETEALRVWAELACCMIREGEREKGELLLNKLLPLLMKNDLAMFLEALNSIGNTAMDAGHPEDALAHYQTVAEIRRKFATSYKTGESLFNLGSCYFALRDYSKAISPLTEALEILRSVLSDSHYLIAETGIRLGISFHQLGEFREAAAAYRVAVRCYKLTDPNADISELTDQLHLAEMQLPLETILPTQVLERRSPFAALTKGLDFVTARNFVDVVRRFYARDYVRCAEVALSSMPKLARYDVIQMLLCSLERLGLENLFQSVGRYALTVSAGSPPYQNLIKFLVGQQSEEEMRRLVGDFIPEHTIDFAVVCKLTTDRREPLINRVIETAPNSLEGISSLVEKYLWAVPLRPPTESEQTVLGELVLQLEREELLNERREIVGRLTQTGEFDKAIVAQTELLKLSKETAEKNPIPYAMDLNNLAHILFKRGRYEESLSFYEQCVAVLQAVPDSIEAGDAANSLGNTYWKLKRFPDAIRCHELATELRIKTYGNHPIVGFGLLDLAFVYQDFDRSGLKDVYNRALQCAVDGLGEKFPQLIYQLKWVIAKTLSDGDFDSAYRTLRDAMGTWEAIIEATRNPRDLLEAGIAHQIEGRTEAAVSFMQLAVDGAAKNGLVDVKIASIIELGKIALRSNNMEVAFRLAGQALESIRQLDEDIAYLRARALLLMASCLVEHGDEREKVLPLLLAEIVEIGDAAEPRTHVVAHTLNARINIATGKQDQAIVSLKTAIRATDALPKSEALTLLYGIASLLKACNADPSECLERAQARIAEAGEIAEQQQALFMSMQCSQAIATGDYARAYSLCQEALQLLSKASQAAPQVRAELLESFGTLSILSQRDLNRAAEAFKMAAQEYEKLGGSHGLSKARARVSLAKALLSANDFGGASRAIVEAMDDVQKAVGEDHWLYADALATGGRINLRIGARETAEYQLSEARGIFAKVYGEDDVHVLLLDEELSLLHLVNNKWDQALKEAHRSRLALERLYPQSREAQLTCRKIEARANYALGNVDLALQDMSAVLSDGTLLYLQVAQATNNAERMRMASSVSQVLSEILTMVWKSDKLKAPEWIETLFLAIVRSKRLATEMFSRQEDALRKSSDTTLQKKLAELKELRSLHAQTALTDPRHPLADKEQANLARLQGRIDRLEYELSLAIPQLVTSQDIHRVTIENLSAQLSPEQVMVIYEKFDEVSPIGWLKDPLGTRNKSQYLAFVLTGASVRIISLGAGAEIDKLVEDYLSDLKTDEETNVGPSRLLFDRLVQPLHKELAGARALYIVPDGSLYSLPFEAIHINDNTLLSDLFGVTYLEAARDLLRPRDEVGQPSEPVVIAAPDYDLAGTSGDKSKLSEHEVSQLFPPLAGAAEEGRLVAELLGTEAITGAAATETRLKSVSSPRVLHLATHGYFLPVRRDEVYDSVEMITIPGEGTYIVEAKPKYVEVDSSPFHQSRLQNPMLRSGMALAGANTWINRRDSRLEAEDGLLSSADITGLDLRSTELVVLSACETGLGVIDDTEGVLGVRRAFVIAGTDSLVCSLWKVPDEETKQLMVSFYSHIKNGARPSAALNLAKEELRGQGYSPLAWAGFIHIGRF